MRFNFVHALGIEIMEVLSFSVGSMIAHESIAMDSNIVDRIILAETGLRGGVGTKNVTKLSEHDTIRAILTLKNVKTYLFSLEQ